MKVLLVTQYFKPENLPVNFIADSLVKNGYKLDVLTGKPNYPKGKFFKGFGFFSKIKQSFQNYDVYRVPIFPRGVKFRTLGLVLNYTSFVFSASILGPLLLRKKKYDIIFVYANSPLTKAIPAIVLGKIKKIPVILWVQDLWPESFMATGYKLPVTLEGLLNKIVSWIYDNVDLILGQSEAFVKKIKEEHPLNDRKVDYLPNTINSIFSPSLIIKTELTSHMDPFKDTFNILFTGNIGEAQSIETVILAANELKTRNLDNINFIIVGGGSKLQESKDRAYEMNLENIHFLGSFPLEEMPSFINFSDVLLLTLKDELTFNLTVPNKLQSYLASGKPILASLNGEAADLIIKSNSGFVVKSQDYKDLADKAIYMSGMKNNDLEELGVNGFEYFDKNFSIEVFIRKISDFFNIAINSRR